MIRRRMLPAAGCCMEGVGSTCFGNEKAGMV